MNLIINGNVTIKGSIVNKEKLSLRQLRGILPSTKEVKTPTRDWVRGHLNGDQVFFSKEFDNGDRLVVFTNGFYCYGDKKWTILRVDGFSRLYYEIDEEGGYTHLEESAFIDDCFIGALGTNAMWQLKRNAEKFQADHGEIPVDNETMEKNYDESIPDVLGLLIEQEEKEDDCRRLMNAMAKLTDAQREAVIMRYYGKMTIPQIAESIGRSEDTVKDRLKGAIRSLKNNF